MPNSNLATADIQTHYAKVGKKGELVLEHYESNEFGLLCNLLASRTKTKKIINIKERKNGEKRKKKETEEEEKKNML